MASWIKGRFDAEEADFLHLIYAQDLLIDGAPVMDDAESPSDQIVTSLASLFALSVTGEDFVEYARRTAKLFLHLEVRTVLPPGKPEDQAYGLIKFRVAAGREGGEIFDLMIALMTESGAKRLPGPAPPGPAERNL